MKCKAYFVSGIYKMDISHIPQGNYVSSQRTLLCSLDNKLTSLTTAVIAAKRFIASFIA